ncbi:MAG TPA: hypothetical protein PK375_02140 [Rhodocyclaceae bacterium]|nr:hypothetical protein [Rhodocyclaceae bacterium]
MNETTIPRAQLVSAQRAEVRVGLKLWQYLAVLDSISKSWDDDEHKRHTMLMSVLEDVAFDAWRMGRQSAEKREAKAA